MKKLMLPIGPKKELVDKLIAKLNPYFVILFGSIAKSPVREDSDMDLANFGDVRLSPYEKNSTWRANSR